MNLLEIEILKDIAANKLEADAMRLRMRSEKRAAIGLISAGSLVLAFMGGVMYFADALSVDMPYATVVFGIPLLLSYFFGMYLLMTRRQLAFRLAKIERKGNQLATELKQEQDREQ